jgi:hypothetical protein
MTIKERVAIKRQRMMKARRIQRERDLLHTLGILIRATRKVMSGMTPEQFDLYGEIVDPLPAWEHYHDVLSTGSREEKKGVSAGLKDMATVRRSYLFKPDFNYRNWLFENNNQSKGATTNIGVGDDSKKRIRA